MTRIIQTIGGAVVTLAIAAPMAAAQYSHAFALQRFTEQVAAYMAVRRDVEQRVPVPTVTADATNIVAMQNALATALRAARPRAQAGDFFSPEVSAEVRHRIHRVLELRRVSESGLVADFQRESPQSFCTLAVNGNFDWRFGAMMPTVVLEALPDLPWPLQYRFVCRDLVMLDVDAGLILDILPDALDAS